MKHQFVRFVKNNKPLEVCIKTKSEQSTYNSNLTSFELLFPIGEFLDKQTEYALCGKYLSAMTNKPTNINNQNGLLLSVRYEVPAQVWEVRGRFLCFVELERTDGESIFFGYE